MRFGNILHGFLSEISTSQTPDKTFLQYFEQKSFTFSEISQPRLGKNMCIAMQNMTESLKKTS